jgi:hypothetical protein
VLNLALGVVLVAHGIGHVLFLAPALRLVEWAGQSSQSWLLSDVLGDPLTRAVAAVGWAAATILFLVGAFGFMTRLDWWRPVLLAGAVVSLAAIVVMWDGIATSNALMAAAVDVVVIAAIAWAIRPTTSAPAP